MIGQTVSHYRILGKLGAGGMGIVYKAEDLSLQRIVALKFLPPDAVSIDSERSRLIHEARAAAALLHPNICPVYEIGESEGQAFIAMAYLDGRSLRDHLSDGPLSLDDALKAAREIGEALSAAHEKGIVHRDVKPGNVMVTPEGRAVLMDFGLARMTGSTKLTRSGMTVGTAAYMSPEQVQGREVDARSDLWALGVVLYEMVSGGLPFHADYEPALFYAIANAEPKRLVNEKIPAGLDGVIAKALAKEPGKRYQTAAEFVADVRALELDREALPAGKAKPAKGLRRLWRSWRPWQRVAAVGAVCVVAGVIALVQVRSARNASNLKNAVIAVIEFRNSVNPDDPTVSSGITQLVQVGLTEASPIRVISPELLYDIRRRLFGSQRGSIEPDQVFEVAKTAGSTFFLTGEMMGPAGEEFVTWRLVETKTGKSLGGRRATGRTMMELADGIIHAVVPLLPGPAEDKTPESLSSVSEIVTSSKEAYEHYVKAELAAANLDQAVTGGRSEAVAELQKAIAIDSTFALAYLRLAQRAYDMVDAQELKDLTEKAWTYRNRLGLRDRMTLEGYREELDGNVPAALITYREIHARWPDNKDALIWLTGTAFWYWYLEEAVTLSEQGLALYPDEKLFLSINLSASREFGRGEEALQAWKTIAKEQQTPFVWSELGENYWTQGFPDSAEACIRRGSYDGLGERERRIAACFYSRGDVNHAIQMLEALMKQPDDNNEHKQTLLNGWAGGLVDYMAEIGRFNRSFELLDEYESVTGKAVAKKVYLLTQMGQAAKAVDLARTDLKGMTSARDSLAVNLNLIEALVAAGSVEEARGLLTAVLTLDENVLWGPNKYRALLLRSVVSLAEGDPEGALKVIHETEKMAKPTLFLRFGAAYRETLARAYWKSGRLKEAADAYESLLRVFGGHAISHYELGQVYEEMKRPADAKREYARFLEMWSEADEGLPQPVDARKRIANL